MPTGKNWVNFLYVNLAFVLYIIGVYYLTTIQEIKNNWPLYRCNPLYMFLSDNIEKDFAYCVQSTQINFMGYLLQPLTFITSSITNSMSGFLTEINYVRGMFNKIRNFISSIIQNIFGVFLNIVIEFQRITISIKDTIAKTIGIVVTLMYVMDGSIKTMGSTWNGPPGQMVRALGKCFHPETVISLKNGNIVQMKELKLGDVLENGSIVRATMQIDNSDTENKEDLYYIIDKNKQNKIHVTGSHLVYDNDTSKFILVKDYKYAIKSNTNTDVFCCLITDNHMIQIGSELFWDWEDHFIKFPQHIT